MALMGRFYGCPASAVRYLTKPVDVTELLAALDDLLDRMDTGFS